MSPSNLFVWHHVAILAKNFMESILFFNARHVISVPVSVNQQSTMIHPFPIGRVMADGKRRTDTARLTLLEERDDEAALLGSECEGEMSPCRY